MIPEQKVKERSSDRILVLKPKDGTKVLSSLGTIDPRVFSGENRLHLYSDPRNCIWKFRYEMGGVPQPLKQGFTTFPRALEHAKQYFAKRNVEITEVLD